MSHQTEIGNGHKRKSGKKSDRPIVSIIIPTYNRAHLIGETLDSILAQTYSHWECIIVDDGSTDRTDEVVQQYLKKDRRFYYYHRPKDRPKGANACRNYGFEMSKGEYVNWFDDDDLMLEENLDLKVKVLERGYKIAISSGVIIDENSEEIGQLNIADTDDLFSDFALWKVQITTGGVVFLRKILEDSEMFNLNIHRSQEREFFSRVFYGLNRDKYYIFERHLYKYRMHKYSKTNQDQPYHSSFKKDHAYVFIENIIRARAMQHKYLIQNLYKRLVSLIFEAIEHQDKKTACEILMMSEDIFANRRLHYLYLRFWIKTLLLINRRSYRIENHLKKLSFD